MQLSLLGDNAQLRKKEGELLFMEQINNVVKFFGLAEHWPDADMMREAAQLAYQEYNWLTVVEVKYFFTKLKTGKYTNNKNMRPGVFMEFLNEFAKDIANARATIPKVKPEEKFVDTAMVSAAIANMVKYFDEIEQIQLEAKRNKLMRKNENMKRHRDDMILELVERDAAKGIAPDKFMMPVYLKIVNKRRENG